MDLDGWLYAFGLLGTFAFACSGALAGAEKKMDIFGMFILAVVTSSGGGILRSVLINAYPLDFFRNPIYIIVAAVATFAVFYAADSFKRHSRPLLTFDAFGLAVFLSTGISTALAHHMNFWAAIIMGIITATFGGVIRDVLCADVPLIFRKEFYASAALLGGLVYFLMLQVGVVQPIVTIVASATVFLARELSIRNNWSLPRMAKR